MGYCYGYTASGRQALACDGCGTVGGVRKRACRFRVTSDTLRSAVRIVMSYCSPPALCAACFKAAGGSKGIHGEQCREGAAKSQAEYDATEAALDAGESFVIAAWGDWQPGVPEGMVGVLFRGRAGETGRLVTKACYSSRGTSKLSDYPDALPWAGTGRSTKQAVPA